MSPISFVLALNDTVTKSGTLNGGIATYTLSGPDGLSWECYWFLDLSSTASTHDSTPLFSSAKGTGGGIADSENWIGSYSNVSFERIAPSL